MIQKNAKKQQPTKGGKKNQKEEEDFDAVLAEFSEKPAKQTAAADKKGKKNKKVSEMEFIYLANSFNHLN